MSNKYNKINSNSPIVQNRLNKLNKSKYKYLVFNKYNDTFNVK